MLGLNIRIGMEDTVWMWPHRNAQIESNLQHYTMFKQIIELMGREIISPDEFKKKMGMRKPGGKLKAV